MFQPLFVGRLALQQDYTKTTEWISTTLGWRMGLGLEWTPLTLRVDQDQGDKSNHFYSLPFTLRDLMPFSDIFITFSVNNAWIFCI